MSAVAINTSVPRLDAGTVAAVLVTIIAWASAFPGIRVGLTAFGPAELGAIRFGVAAIPAIVFLLHTRPQMPTWSEAWRFAYGGVVFVAFYTTLLNFGELTVSAGAASFIINVAPIFTAFMAMLFLGERFSRLAWLGTFVSFAGIGLIALGEGEGIKVDQGALLILGAAFCTASTTIVQKPLFRRHKPLTVSAANMVIGALALSWALPSGIAQASSASFEALVSVIYLGIVPSFVAYGSWAVALSRLPASRATNFLYCVPPTATLMGFLWLGEVPGVAGIIGGLMALGGVVLVNLKR
ncbi:EamA family transporter [Mesorhizobium sp. BAC0120]|uniref:DMT family transporter n=1 Tax=Mesorhizobium sp. BAC0120 TaxID=3090670 RepID=UPI00298C097C|nr:EamA family transporter [Mesorhizobium sp. BAC0120]MDW6024152.1 EamA family transporter [Mesorhizobium sp. BAC0120]